MNSKTAKLIKRFSKIGIVEDSRQLALSSNPKKIIKRLYSNIIKQKRYEYKQYMRNQILKFRSLNVD